MSIRDGMGLFWGSVFGEFAEDGSEVGRLRGFFGECFTGPLERSRRSFSIVETFAIYHFGFHCHFT